MNRSVVLLRGINVGGKNKIAMAALRDCLTDLGFSEVMTYIASGNVLLSSEKDSSTIKTEIEAALIQNFKLDSELIKVLVLSLEQLKAIINNKPNGFGEEPTKYHSDVIFLMNIVASEAMAVFTPREGVDTIWSGDGVIYSQRLSAERTKSRLNKVMGSPLYKSMTIRTWGTTTKLLELLNNTSSHSQ